MVEVRPGRVALDEELDGGGEREVERHAALLLCKVVPCIIVRAFDCTAVQLLGVINNSLRLLI